MIWCRRSRRRLASACPDGSRAGGDPRAQQLFHFILGYIHGAPLVRNGVPFALVKSPLDLDGLRDEATGICRSKLRTCPSRCTIRQPSGCRNAGIDSLSGSANLQGVRARARTAASSSVSLMAIASGILATTCGERLVGRTLSEAPAASREAVSGPGSIGVPIIGLATPGSLVWPSGRKIDGCHWSHGGAGTPVR